MSIRVVQRIFDESPVQGHERLVLIVLGDHAKDDGTDAWPSVATIARKARMTERGVQRCLRGLEAGGHIRSEGPARAGRPDRRPTRYAVVLPGERDDIRQGVNAPTPRSGNGVNATTSRGERQDISGVNATTPEPLGEPSLEPDSPNPSGRADARAGANEEDRPDLSKRISSILAGAVDSLSENDHGRSWPQPRLAKIRRALAEHEADPELAEEVARDVRAIVQSQDKAYNISGLYAKRLGEVIAERAEVRRQVADSLAGAP